MFQKLQTFWNNFWYALKQAYNQVFKNIPKEKTQDFRDTKHINFLAIFVSKLNNLANTEATFDVKSDSTQTERLKELCKDLEAKRFDITSDMLAEGDLWVFPATDGSGNLYHRYVTQDKVRVLNMDGEKITDLIGVIDQYVDDKNNVYFLNRRHTLDGNTLTIETYTTNERYERVNFDEWAELESAYQLTGVDSIGVGRFKSPTSSRGFQPVYGVPLTFGCEEIEQRCFNDLKLIETEFERAESKIFADPRMLVRNKDGKGKDGWTMPEGVFPIGKTAGTTGSAIDIFSPEIRYSAYYSKLVNDMAQFEQQVGTDKGFLTPFESVSATTATEIRRANASTIALIDKIHTAIKNGVEQTLKADGIFLNVARDLYSIQIGWSDAFADETETYNRIREAANEGRAEDTDVMQWLFPELSLDELNKKLERIENKKSVNEDEALEKMLMGEV